MFDNLQNLSLIDIYVIINKFEVTPINLLLKSITMNYYDIIYIKNKYYYGHNIYK